MSGTQRALSYLDSSNPSGPIPSCAPRESLAVMTQTDTSESQDPPPHPASHLASSPMGGMPERGRNGVFMRERITPSCTRGSGSREVREEVRVGIVGGHCDVVKGKSEPGWSMRLYF